MKIGVLALQGAFIEHIQALKKLGINATEIRVPKDLQGLQGIIIPGGESTTIRKLMNWTEVKEKILENVSNGMKVFGTCAGTILLAKEIVGEKKETLKLIEISVARNAYGRQVNSFEKEIKVKGIGTFNAVFIRAPIIEKIGKNVNILAECNGKPVLVENENCLAATFHPELTKDLRIHKYFLEKIGRKK